MTKKLKPEFQPGGSKRHEILDKAVRYIQDPRFGLQSDKKFFLLEQVGLTTTEYLEALNRASNGGLVKVHWETSAPHWGGPSRKGSSHKPPSLTS